MSLRLMAILAHPDDESLGNGGALARYAAEGVDVTLITATRGERGWFGPPDSNPGLQALGQIREQELKAAANVLGIHRVELLDYIDGDLDQADPLQATRRIAAVIRRERPQVVLTFGLDGAYGHPDHIAISQLTTAAIVSAADEHAVDKLYHMAVTRRRAESYTAAFGDLIMDIDGVERTSAPLPDWMVNARIDAGDHWRTAWQAVACHRTQLPGYEKLLQLPEKQHRYLWGQTEYIRVFSRVNGGRALESDLFEGLRPTLTDPPLIATAQGANP